jgi:hypothetical protein
MLARCGVTACASQSLIRARAGTCARRRSCGLEERIAPRRVQGSVRAWLFTVARNIVIDGRAPGARAPDPGLQSRRRRATPARAADDLGRGDAVTRLSPEHRAVLQETYFKGRPVAGPPVASASPRHREVRTHALHALRLALEEWGWSHDDVTEQPRPTVRTDVGRLHVLGSLSPAERRGSRRTSTAASSAREPCATSPACPGCWVGSVPGVRGRAQPVPGP